MPIFQLKITLDESKPLIWRRFLVEDSISFHQLHEIIQIVMGWESYHLYQFSVNGLEMGLPDPDSEIEIDSRKKKLRDLLAEKQNFSYMYDFGDGWEHTIIVEKVLNKENKQKTPICIDGKRSCPPEDCGGIGGYEDLLKILSNPSDPEHKSMKKWAPKNFDSERFDISMVNEMLSALK